MFTGSDSPFEVAANAQPNVNGKRSTIADPRMAIESRITLSTFGFDNFDGAMNSDHLRYDSALFSGLPLSRHKRIWRSGCGSGTPLKKCRK